MSSIKLKKNESFYIREGWFEKAINTIKKYDTNIFYKNDGIQYLGIGSNMVKGLKYWLRASGVIDPNDSSLTEFGNLLYKHDRYLDDLFSWYLIHYNLTVNEEECPVAYEVYNSSFKQFRKSEILEYITNRFLAKDPTVNRKMIEADLNTFLTSYCKSNVAANPEDNYICPLSRLKLIQFDKEIYKRIRPAYSSLSYLIIYYVLLEKYNGESFEIEDSMKIVNSPILLFNLDKYMYLQYLDDMRKNGLITINRTAGLNTVYFEKVLSLEEIFDEKFGGPKENV